MTIVVRPIEVGDLESVADLMVEMDEFYDDMDRESTDTKIANMREFLFGTSPSAYLLIAHDRNDTAALGMAAYSYLWPAVGSTRSLYLKELYVKQSRRRSGVASALMAELIGRAEDLGCTRVEWTTDRDNGYARRFYASLGADEQGGKIFYRL